MDNYLLKEVSKRAKHLKGISIVDCKCIGEEGAAAILQLPSLQFLICSQPPLSGEEVTRLQISFPNINIVVNYK